MLTRRLSLVPEQARIAPVRKINVQTLPRSPYHDYKVVDCIRFMAICSVVWGHCSLGMENKVYHSVGGIVLQSVALQAGKSGTILFFLISGIILQLKLQKLTCAIFIKSRIKPIIIPWLTAVAVFCLLMMFNTPLVNMWHNYSGMQKHSGTLLATLNATLFHTTYWFIIVYFISALLLILVKKYVGSTYTGIILGLVTLFYCVNLYYGWVSVFHTKAFLGYIFIMWLGIIIGTHFSRAKSMVGRIPRVVLLAVFVVAMLLACYEGVVLTQKNCLDAYASIRFTNILQALIVFICLLKLGEVALINRLNPRKYTYHIYLVHCMVIYEITMLVNKYIDTSKKITCVNLFFNQIILFMVVLTTTYLIVKIYKKLYKNILLKPYNQTVNATE